MSNNCIACTCTRASIQLLHIVQVGHGIMVSEHVHADDEHCTLESGVRGHHVFKATWTPWTGQMLQVHAELYHAFTRTHSVYKLHPPTFCLEFSAETNILANMVPPLHTHSNTILSDTGKLSGAPCTVTASRNHINSYLHTTH